MTESNQDSISKGIDSLNQNNRHKLQKELLQKTEAQNASPTYVNAGPNELPASAPDLQGSIETTVIEKSTSLPKAKEVIEMPTGPESQALQIREYTSTTISANDQRKASSPALRLMGGVNDPMHVASESRQFSVERHASLGGRENANAQDKVGRSDSNPDQSLSRAATLQQYINSKK